MKRRTFFGLAASLVLAPSVLFANAPIEYTEGFIKQELAAGKTVFVDYAAVWCSTCKRQERLIEQLRKNNPEYDKNMTFVRVDWDVYSTEPVAEDRNIPRRSTLIVLRGDKELGRIVAGTDINEIKALMDKGLAQ